MASTGFRNSITQVQDIGGWKFNNVINLSNINSITEQRIFFQAKVSVAKTFQKLKNYQVSASYSVEHNEIHNKVTDSVHLRVLHSMFSR